MRRTRGIINSVELMIIVSAVVVIAFILSSSWGRMVMNQATSNKGTAMVNEAHVWEYEDTRGRCTYVSATFQVTNMGGKRIEVREVSLQNGNGGEFDIGNVGRYLNPGETALFSVNSSGCSGFNPPPEYKSYLYVKFRIDGENRDITIGTPVIIQKLSG